MTGPSTASCQILVSPRVRISPHALLDCTGTILACPWCNIGPRKRIYTHDTIHMGKEPMALLEEEFGVLWQDKTIGADVWIHDGSIVLCKANRIPDGVVLVAGSVLTIKSGTLRDPGRCAGLQNCRSQGDEQRTTF